MKICSLGLLSFLFLASRELLMEAHNGVKSGRNRLSDRGPQVTPGKPPSMPEDSLPRVIVTGGFITRDQAKCNMTVTKQENVSLQVDCIRLDHVFSCVFVGDPAACLHCLDNATIYWTQITWHLSRQKYICEDSKAILETRVCRKKYPESNLKLVSSTLVGCKTRRQEPFPTEAVKTKQITTTEQVQIAETTPTTGQIKGRGTTHTTPKQAQENVPTEQIKGRRPAPTTPNQAQETSPTESVEIPETTTASPVQTQVTTTAKPSCVTTSGIKARKTSQWVDQQDQQRKQQVQHMDQRDQQVQQNKHQNQQWDQWDDQEDQQREQQDQECQQHQTQPAQQEDEHWFQQKSQ
nr:fibroblast growth factor-binding protein 1-like [Oryctolagus cuniculus]